MKLHEHFMKINELYMNIFENPWKAMKRLRTRSQTLTEEIALTTVE